MKSILLIIAIVSIFGGCGNSNTKSKLKTYSADSIVKEDIQKHKKIVQKDERTLTIYVHGYSQEGYKRDGVFGNDNYDKVIDKMVEFSGFSTTKNYTKDPKENIIAITPYYGKIAPSYYTPSDLDELEKMGEGVPRYAFIIAKFTKKMMSETNTTRLNIVSASLGSLITRYIIEKDLEGLSSSKKIVKWLSFEGLIAGNIGASNRGLLNIINTFKQQPHEVKQMKYSWVEENLDLKSPNYDTIDIAFESSTNDNLNSKAISHLTHEANDGVQAVKDTYFKESIYPHAYFHQTHTSLDKATAPWAYAATFLTSHKRVRVTLLQASLKNLHEDDIGVKHLYTKSILPAEVVFASRVYSPRAMAKWNFTEAIDERLFDGHYLNLHKYNQTDKPKELNQVLFNSVVLDDEDKLKVEVTPYEIDVDKLYGVNQPAGHKDKEPLEHATAIVPLENGTYDIRSSEWSGRLKVEVY